MRNRPTVERPRVGASACCGGDEAASPSCWGGGGTDTSASGVDTRAVSWTGRPQFGQKRSSALSSWPQLPQYLFATITLPHHRLPVSGPTSPPLPMNVTLTAHLIRRSRDTSCKRAASELQAENILRLTDQLSGAPFRVSRVSGKYQHISSPQTKACYIMRNRASTASA